MRVVDPGRNSGWQSHKHHRVDGADACTGEHRKRRLGELVMLGTFGICGYLMRCWDYPVAPMIVGLILGPMAESQVRRALQISLGDPFVFFKRAGSATLLTLALLALVAPLIFKGLKRFKGDDA